MSGRLPLITLGHAFQLICKFFFHIKTRKNLMVLIFLLPVIAEDQTDVLFCLF